MKQFHNVWLPDSEEHMQSHIQGGPIFEGKGTYQFGKLARAMAQLSPAKLRLAVDIGAHVGLWSYPLSYMFERVVAFEPVPEFQGCWHRNMEGRPNAQLKPVALGPAEGQLKLQTVSDNSGATHPHPDGNLTVPVKTLGEYAEELGGMDFLKIDCEGAEEGIILGGLAVICKHRPVIIVEQKPGHAERAGYKNLGAVHLLETHGWRVAQVMVGDYVMVPT